MQTANMIIGERCGHVPKTVRMVKTVGPDFPWLIKGKTQYAIECCEYDAVVNTHGAVSVVLPDGSLLGVKPGEFTVSEWRVQ